MPTEKSRATEFRLRDGQPSLTVQEKSAEGIVGQSNEPGEKKAGRSQTDGRPERCLGGNPSGK